MPPLDEPAFSPDDGVQVNLLMYNLAKIESKLIEQKNLLFGLMTEFEDLKRRYPDGTISAKTKEHLMTVKYAIDATLAKAAAIDNNAVVRGLLEG